jgi:hypothetical protein
MLRSLFSSNKEAAVPPKKEEAYVPAFAAKALDEEREARIRIALEIEQQKRNGTFYKNPANRKPYDESHPRECPVCSGPGPGEYREYGRKCEHCQTCGKRDFSKCRYAHICHECHVRDTGCEFCKMALACRQTGSPWPRKWCM